MADAHAPDDSGEQLGREVVDLARALRSELQTLNEGELRRQSRLVTFDQQMAQMESSIRDEVERLRTTGSVVELLADLLRQSLGEVESDRRFAPIHEDLDRLRADIRSLPAPDDQRVLDAVHTLTQRLDRLDRSVAHLQDEELLTGIADRLGDVTGLVRALVLPDLAPLHAQIAGVRDQLNALPQPDLEPLETGLTTGLQRVHDKLDALPQPDLTPLREQLDQLHVRLAAIPTRDLRPIHDRLEALEAAVTALPTPDDSGLREELQSVRSSISSLPTLDLASIEGGLADVSEQVRALPTVDLAPLHADLGQMQDRLAALPSIDLGPLRSQLQALQGQVHDLPQPDDAAVQASVAGVAQQVTDIRRAIDMLPAVDAVQSVTQEVARLGGLVEAIPIHDDTPVRDDVQRLIAEIDALRTAIADRFDALPPPAQVADLLRPALDRLHQIADPSAVRAAIEQSGQQIGTELAAMRSAAELLGDRIDHLPDHTERLEALTSTRDTLEREVTQLSALVAEVAERTQPIAALESGLGGIRDAILSLEAITGASVAGGREAVDAQTLALARVTAATDGFAATVGTLRSAMTTAARAAGEETIASLDERLEGNLRAVEARLHAAIEHGLSSLDLAPLHEGLRGLDERVTALPPPDLGPVAAQLARLSATITSETRVRPATGSQLDALATSLGQATDSLHARLDAQSAEVASMAARLDSLASTADTAATADTATVASDLESIREELIALVERLDRTASASERATQIALQLLQANTAPATAKKAPASSSATSATKKKATSEKKAPAKRTPTKPASPPSAPS